MINNKVITESEKESETATALINQINKNNVVYKEGFKMESKQEGQAVFFEIASEKGILKARQIDAHRVNIKFMDSSGRGFELEAPIFAARNLLNNLMEGA